MLASEFGTLPEPNASSRAIARPSIPFVAAK